jgi:hypothetical protein
MSGRRTGSALLESVLILPILLMLFVGMIEVAKISYTYYTLQKVLANFAKYVGTRQGVNFCDGADPSVVSARNWALTASNDGTADPLVPNLSPDRLEVALERTDPDSGEITDCDCSSSGCDISTGGRAPDFVVTSIADGYSVRIALPFISLDPIVLRPQVRMPYRGT